MTLHWWHIAIAYALTAGAFATLALGAALRERAARKRLAILDPRANRP